jgi:hypothetical protein
MDTSKQANGIFIILAVTVILFLCAYAVVDESVKGYCLPAFPVVIVLVSLLLVWDHKRIKNIRSIKEGDFQQSIKEYDAIKDAINIPETARKIIYYKPNDNSQIKIGNYGYEALIWKIEDNIFLFPTPSFHKKEDSIEQFLHQQKTVPSINNISIEEVKLNTIPLNQIEYLTKSGGIGGLYYFDDKKERCSLFFDADTWQVFYDLIPEKERNFIPATAKKVTYYKSSEKSRIKLGGEQNDVSTWKDNDNILFFPSYNERISLDEIKLNTIPLNQIEYFSKRGELIRENKISGGGGGGSSITGAVVGELIAGDVGAVIGSRKKTDEIKSELITHDTRETFLNYFDDKKERCSLFFDIDTYEVFNDLIPEKEYNIVNAIKSSEIIKNQVSVNSQKGVADQLRELAKLRDDGIITENEFNEKKKQLLDKIS